MIRKALPKDLLDIVKLIHENLLSVNSLDYTEHVINFMISHYSTQHISNLISSKDHFYVFIDSQLVVACIILDNCEAKCLYVRPDFHKKGIGNLLIKHVENLNLCPEISLYASKSAYRFYEKLGYKFISLTDDIDFGPSHFMKKTFVSTL